MNQYMNESLADLLKLAGRPIKRYEIPTDEEGGMMTISKYKGLSQGQSPPYSPQQYLLQLLMRRGGR